MAQYNYINGTIEIAIEIGFDLDDDFDFDNDLDFDYDKYKSGYQISHLRQ